MFWPSTNHCAGPSPGLMSPLACASNFSYTSPLLFTAVLVKYNHNNNHFDIFNSGVGAQHEYDRGMSDSDKDEPGIYTFVPLARRLEAAGVRPAPALPPSPTSTLIGQ